MVEPGSPPRWRLVLLILIALCLLSAAGFLLSRSDGVQMRLLEMQPLSALKRAANAPEATARTHFALGRALEKRGEHAEAAASLQKALEALDTHDDLPLRAQVEGDLAQTLLRVGPERDALFHLKRALELDASIVPAHLTLGEIFVRREQYEPAIKEFTAVTLLEPDNAEGWFQLGRAHNAGREADQAEAPLLRAVKLRPKESRYLRELGDCYGYRARYPEAQHWFEEAVRARPDDGAARAALARAHMLQARTPEEYRRARDEFLPFAGKDADDPYFLGQLGIMDVQFGDLTEGEKHLKRALELMPYHHEASYNLAMVYTRQGRKAEARQVLARFKRMEELHRQVDRLHRKIELDPKNVPLNLELARALEGEGKLGEAFEQLQYTYHVAPDNLGVRTALGAFTGKHGRGFGSGAPGER